MLQSSLAHDILLHIKKDRMLQQKNFICVKNIGILETFLQKCVQISAREHSNDSQDKVHYVTQLNLFMCSFFFPEKWLSYEMVRSFVVWEKPTNKPWMSVIRYKFKQCHFLSQGNSQSAHLWGRKRHSSCLVRSPVDDTVNVDYGS